MQQFIVGQPFPGILPSTQGAISEFLSPENGNTLLMCFPHLTEQEIKAARFGKIEVGLHSKNGAILFIWRIHDESGDVIMTLDSPFEVKRLDKVEFIDIDSSENRMLLTVFLVDLADRKLKSIRSVTLPKETTLEFLSAVQDQFMSSEQAVSAQYGKWMQQQPDVLAEAVPMREMGV